jgi:hypothetical protein
MKYGRGDTVLAARWLIGARLVDSNQKFLGHVIDMEVEPDRSFRVAALELGRFGWLDRLRALRPLAHDRLANRPRVVAWSDIDRFEDGRLICKPGAKVREMAPAERDEASTPDRTASGG